MDPDERRCRTQPQRIDVRAGVFGELSDTDAVFHGCSCCTQQRLQQDRLFAGAATSTWSAGRGILPPACTKPSAGPCCSVSRPPPSSRPTGIAYRVHVPLSTFEGAARDGQAEVTLRLHLTVRDDEWRLYGFGSDGERAVFRALLRVNGVGPVMALSLLSGFRPKELTLRGQAGGDVKALTRVKGVGKKTAERIVVELRDAFQGEGFPGGDGVPGAAGGEAEGPLEDAIRALQSLGLDPVEARKRVTKHAGDDLSAIDTSDLIRKALRS